MITLTLTGKFSRRNPAKLWGKRLTGVTPGGRGGLAFTGPWLVKGAGTVQAAEDGGAAAEDGAVVLFCADRGTPAYWLCRVGGSAPVRPVVDWSGEVTGEGELLYQGTSVAEAVAAAQAAGVPVVEAQVVAPRGGQRDSGGGYVCGYTGLWRPGSTVGGVCPHCGDDC